jgi:hypothetical protein
MATDSTRDRKVGDSDHDEVAVIFRLNRAEREALREIAAREGFPSLQGYLDNRLLGKDGTQRRVGRPPRSRRPVNQEELSRSA